MAIERSLDPARVGDAVRRNLAAVRARIARAAGRSGRDPAAVTLLPVTKYGGDALVEALLALGELDLGENRVDRILDLHARFGERARFHMIGHLQRNKARKVAPAIVSLHSLDSEDAASKLDRARAEKGLTPLGVWIEVNLAGEEKKSGVTGEDAPHLARALAAHAHLELKGLMAIPPEVKDPELSRPHFKALAALLAPVSEAYGRAVVGLSMGMTQDLEVAVEEGATVVRVGRALLEGTGLDVTVEA